MAKKKVTADGKSTSKKISSKQRDELLIENFVGLQKAMVNLSVKFEALSDNLVKLLNVFELSARGVVAGSPKESDKDLLNKIDSLLEQNKTIAKGLVLIEQKVRSRTGTSQKPLPQSSGPGVPNPNRPKPLPGI